MELGTLVGVIVIETAFVFYEVLGKSHSIEKSDQIGGSVVL